MSEIFKQQINGSYNVNLNNLNREDLIRLNIAQSKTIQQTEKENAKLRKCVRLVKTVMDRDGRCSVTVKPHTIDHHPHCEKCRFLKTLKELEGGNEETI